MKKVRSLAAFLLAAAMLLSLTTGAAALSAAEFSDSGEIVNKDAVAMLTELGIIGGYPSGDFQPGGTVTRAEMAKMIFTILNAGSDAAPAPDAQRYADVWDGMWCEGYVAFCDDVGIIAGYGDGKFGPGDTVTGAQAAKMLLVTMGFDPAKEGFTGTNWDYNVLKTASANGLFENFDANISDGCTRDNAALLIYNALIADQVSYVGSTPAANGKTLLGEYFGVVSVTGVVVANQYASLFEAEPLRSGYTEVCLIGDQYIDDDHAIDPGFDVYNRYWLGGSSTHANIAEYFDVQTDDNNGYTQEAVYWNRRQAVNDYDPYQTQIFEVSTDLNQVGTTVTVFAKLKDNGSYYYVSLNDAVTYGIFSGKVVGSPVRHDECVVKEYDGTSFQLFDYKQLKKDGITLDENTRYFVNYATAWAGGGSPQRYWSCLTADAGSLELYNELNAIWYNLPGEYTRLLDCDGDGIVEIVLKERDNFVDADYSKYDQTWDFTGADGKSGWQNVDASDVTGDIADGDKILLCYVDGHFYAEKSETFTATPTVVDYANEDYPFTEIDGKKYIESGVYWVGGEMTITIGEDKYSLGSDITKMDSDGKTYRYYLDSMGNIAAYVDVTATKNTPGKLALLTASYHDGGKFEYGLTYKNETGISLYPVTTNKYSDVENNDSSFFVSRALELEDVNYGAYSSGVLYSPGQLIYKDLVNHFAYIKATALNTEDMIKYGFGDETALINAKQSDDDTVSASVPTGKFAQLDIDFTHLKQRAYAVVPRTTEVSYDTIYATKDTVYFVYLKTMEHYTNNGYSKDYFVTKVYSFTGYDALGQFNSIRCAYALVSSKSAVATAIVFEVDSDQMVQSDGYAYVCGLMSESAGGYQVLYIDGEGQVKTMTVKQEGSDCFEAETVGPDEIVFAAKRGLYVIDGDCLCSPDKYVGVAGSFTVDNTDIAAAVKTEYLADKDGFGYYDLTDNTKYLLTVYYQTEAGNYYRRVVSVNDVKAFAKLIADDSDEVTAGRDYIVLYSQAVDGSYVDNNVNVIIGSVQLGSREAANERIGSDSDLDWVDAETAVTADEAAAAVAGE